MSATDELWLAVGHVRGAKTKIADARFGHSISPSIDSLLRLLAQDLYKVERALISHAKQVEESVEKHAEVA